MRKFPGRNKWLSQKWYAAHTREQLINRIHHLHTLYGSILLILYVVIIAIVVIMATGSLNDLAELREEYEAEENVILSAFCKSHTSGDFFKSEMNSQQI